MQKPNQLATNEVMAKGMAMRCRNQTNWQQTKSEQHDRDMLSKWQDMVIGCRQLPNRRAQGKTEKMQMETHDEQTRSNQ
jgi:hypothetical protein